MLSQPTKPRQVSPSIVVIFGASGDLTARKLIPAIYNLSVDKLLPEHFKLIGFGRKSITDQAFRDHTADDIRHHSRRPLDQNTWNHIENNVYYHVGAYDDPVAYTYLADSIKEFEKNSGHPYQLLFYISTPPTVFAPILENLGKSGLASHNSDKPNFASKVIIEKPFGRDLDSAHQLNRIMRQQFAEDQIYRIDHYLGKETVQNLLVQRFANAIFEPIWNFHHIDCVQITVAETIGVGTRAGYYDQSGALRDMIQNHTMQLLSLVAMEPPVSLSPQDIRDEKVKLLKAIHPFQLEPGNADVVRAQYTAGIIDDQAVKGYLEEDGIAKNSCTETYAALRLKINNWRWQGVPFYIRSGKRLAQRTSEIAIQFRSCPGSLFSDSQRFELAPNTMVIKIQPDEGATIIMNSKVPGIETRTQPVKMFFRYASTFTSDTPEAYERLILDALSGDNTLFIRGDETETSWKLMTPVLDYWAELGDKELETYPAGSWGPTAAEQLLWSGKHSWRKPT